MIIVLHLESTTGLKVVGKLENKSLKIRETSVILLLTVDIRHESVV